MHCQILAPGSDKLANLEVTCPLQARVFSLVKYNGLFCLLGLRGATGDVVMGLEISGLLLPPSEQKQY